MTPFNRLLAVMLNPFVAASYMIVVVLSYLYFDKSIAYFFHNLDLRSNLIWLNWITKLGLGAFYLISLLFLALFFRYVYKKPTWEARAWFLWVVVLVPSLICFVLKVLLGRARPSLLFEEHLYGFFGLETHVTYWSFPSGHTTTIMALAFGLCIIVPRYAYAFLVVGISIAVSRILLTHHFLSDVLMAGYLALLEVGIIYALVRRKSLVRSINCLNI